MLLVADKNEEEKIRFYKIKVSFSDGSSVSLSQHLQKVVPLHTCGGAASRFNWSLGWFMKLNHLIKTTLNKVAVVTALHFLHSVAYLTVPFCATCAEILS